MNSRIRIKSRGIPLIKLSGDQKNVWTYWGMGISRPNPPSLLVRACFRYIAPSHYTLARSLRSLIEFLTGIYSHSATKLERILRCLWLNTRDIASGFGLTVVALQEIPEMPLAIATTPIRIFEDVRIDRGGYKATIRRVVWMPYPPPTAV